MVALKVSPQSQVSMDILSPQGQVSIEVLSPQGDCDNLQVETSPSVCMG